MNCSECIYGYYTDACNAPFEDEEEYFEMIRTEKCPYFGTGHRMYLFKIKNKSVDEIVKIINQ